MTTSHHASPVLVLGAGLAGLSAAYHLRGRQFVLVERERQVGGKARSHRRDGYTFDVTGHWLHLRDPRMQALVQDLFPPGDLVTVERKTNIWSHGALLHYPFQANLHGLPPEVVRDCLVGFLEAQKAEARGEVPPPATFEAFARARFGDGIAEQFFVPYNSKLWGAHFEDLTAEWVSRYIPMPDSAQVIGGAVGVPQHGLGYNVSFQYPRAGGIDHLPRRLAEAVRAREDGEVVMPSDVEEIDVEGRRLKLSAEADWRPWSRIISTMPLPELVRRIPSAPAQVREAAAALRWVRWRYLDVATRTAPRADYHWVYVPERHYPFFRVGVYSNAVDSMAPAGCGSMYVELEDRSSPPNLSEVAQALVHAKVLDDVSDVAFMQTRDVEYAYVVFDDAWGSSRVTILGWLESVGIRSCGRYGAWVYNAMEDSMIQGMEAAAWAAGDGAEVRA